MSDLAQETETWGHARLAANWGAIWVGVFTFVGIWAVFGTLGEAVFASSTPTLHSGNEWSVGLGIWAVILTIIGMFVAGRATADLAGVSSLGARIMHGISMFGVTITAALLIVIVSDIAFAGKGVVGTAQSSYMLTVFSNMGWLGFSSLLLGWLAAMGGAASAGVRQTNGAVRVREIRPAA